MQDADVYTNTLDMPFRFYPCLAAGLAYYLALKRAPNRVQLLKAVYEEEFERAGYKLPKIVFWNLDAHMGTPAQCDDDSVAMVSGFSPSIMKAVLNAEDFTPMDVMLEALKPIDVDYKNLPKDFSYVSEI